MAGVARLQENSKFRKTQTSRKPDFTETRGGPNSGESGYIKL